MKEIWLKVEISTLKSEKENLLRTLEESAEEIREKDTKWQKLKEFIKTNIENDIQEYEKSQNSMFAHYLSIERFILNKMQELEGEDE